MSTQTDSPNLDVLRSIAVSAVLADHMLEMQRTQIGLPITQAVYYVGRVGVLLFFVHTSLVLMLSMERTFQHKGGSKIWDLFVPFYIRRAFRVYPLSVICVIAVVTFHIPSIAWEPHYTPPTRGGFVSNLLLTQNLTYTEPILGPIWSLPLEVQMYAILPGLFLILGEARSISRAIAMWGVAVVCAIILPRVTGRLSVAIFGPCFLGGIVAYAGLSKVKRRFAASLWPVSIGVLVLCYVLAEDRDRSSDHSPEYAWAFCLVVGGLIPFFHEQTSRVVKSGAHLIARYSYGIYLGHMIALWVVFQALQVTNLFLAWGLFAILLAIISILSYHLIERPFVLIGASLASRKPGDLPLQHADVALCYEPRPASIKR